VDKCKEVAKENIFKYTEEKKRMLVKTANEYLNICKYSLTNHLFWSNKLIWETWSMWYAWGNGERSI